MPTVYAVASAKGGVGKTTTAANLAATLAAAGFDTVAVDGDIGTPNLGATLGVDVPEDGGTLHDVLADEADPLDATYPGPHGLAVMPGDRSLSAFRSADPSRITDVLDSITNADFVVLDTGSGLTHESALPLSLADRVLLVSTPARDALVDTSKTIALAERLGGTVEGVALTRVGPEDTLESALADLDTADFDVPALGRVPEDATVPEAITAGEPLSTHAPSSDAAAAYRSLASSLTGEPIRPAISAQVGAGEPEPATPEAEADGTSAGADEAESEEEADADEAEEGEPDVVETNVPEAEVPETGAPETERTDAAEASTAEAAEEDEADAEAPEPDDGVIIDGSATDDEDEAAAAARRTVLGEQVDEEFDGDDPVTVADAESGEEVEIEDDVIPFAEQGRERAEQAKQGQSEEEADDDGTGGGILSRLFR